MCTASGQSDESDADIEPTKIDFPTDERPGSVGKILRMRYRLENGMAIHSPGDETKWPTTEEQDIAAQYCQRAADSKRKRGKK